MSWQKCPLCDGRGQIVQGLSNQTLPEITTPCRACNGAGSISELTGLPPIAFTDTKKRKQDENK